jgi:hypothetical protein
MRGEIPRSRAMRHSGLRVSAAFAGVNSGYEMIE